MNSFPSDVTKCANCGAILGGKYCKDCGQKANTIRLELKALLNSIFKSFVEFDASIFKTVRELTFNPGQVSLNYIHGARIAYINPIKYCLTIFAITLAIMHITGQIDKTIERIDAQNTASLELNKSLNTETTSLRRMYQKANLEVYAEYLQPMQLILIPIAGLFLRIQHARRRRNYAETISFLCFVFGHTALINIPIILGMSLLGLIAYYNLLVYSGFLLFIFWYGSKVFFELSWARSFVSLLISAALYFVLAGTIMMIAAELRVKGII